MQVWHPKLSQLKYIYHLISNSPLILKKPWNKNIASVNLNKGQNAHREYKEYLEQMASILSILW